MTKFEFTYAGIGSCHLCGANETKVYWVTHNNNKVLHICDYCLNKNLSNDS